MDWFTPIDAYCERTAPDLLAEPMNLLTNAVFILMAFLMWRRSQGQLITQILADMLALIGVGSPLFHSFVQTWAAVVDVFPIMAFVRYYVLLPTVVIWVFRFG
jgi:hypothetical protein